MFLSKNTHNYLNTSSDYYPYGMLMDNRHGVEDSKYRYGFQGQESDDEVKGEGNSVNYKYRMHDPRIGRFFAIDPLAPKYPWYTPYQFSGNKVIHAVELEGLEEAPINESLGSNIDGYDFQAPAPGSLSGSGYSSSPPKLKDRLSLSANVNGTVISGTGSGISYSNANFNENIDFDKYWDAKNNGTMTSQMYTENGWSRFDPMTWKGDVRSAVEDHYVEMSGDHLTYGINMLKATTFLFTAGGGITNLNQLSQMASFVGRTGIKVGSYSWSAIKVYHNTIGKFGGEKNALGNFASQSIANKFDLSKTNILGVISSGFVVESNGLITNGIFNSIASGGLISINANGTYQTFNETPIYGGFTTVNGILLGPTLSPFGNTLEVGGTSAYQLFLNYLSEKDKLD